jgi:CxxC-x17-CxxC domain-containing protein
MYNSFRPKSAGSSGDRKFSKKGTWNRAGGGKPAPRELHDAICSECRKPCQVPFFPSEGRPVKCRDCFRTDDSPRDDRRPSYGDRPAYVSRPHSDDRRPTANTRSSGDIESRLRTIERKLDNILELLDADDIE